MSIEARLRRLEQSGGCPWCAPAHEAVIKGLSDPAYNDAPLNRPRCGSDVRITLEEIDAILDDEEEGRG